MAGRRSKQSLIPALNLGVDLLQSRKLGKMKNELDTLKLGIGVSLVQINSVYDLTIANNQMLREVDSKLVKLSAISWKIASYFDRLEQKEQFIADMRFAIFTFNKKLDEIEEYMDEKPEFALYETDIILELIEDRDLRAEHFAIVSQDEMDRAQKFLDRFHKLRAEIIAKLE